MTTMAYCRLMHTGRGVVVVGAGVSGLTTAICLAEAGYQVRMVAEEVDLSTTSCAAGAIWGPYLSQDERVLSWSDETRQILLDLAADVASTGVRSVHGLEAARVPTTPPAWASPLPGYRTATPDELPAGFSNGWWYSAPLVDMPVYLRYLRGRLDATGTPVEQRTIDAFPQAAAPDEIVVNCTGAGAGKLTGDASIVPTRGQLAVVENPGIDEFFCEHDESRLPIYYLPHGAQLVLGGSIEPGSWDREPDADVARQIVAQCATIEPRVAGAKVLDHRVGIRPNRPTVRLEHERLGALDVIHNYGHGGAGVTVSWGCALAVTRIVATLRGL
ncbi:FAD-dependent oxidoreductase [Dactylosporangium fulvum]|nr:FAD-dependent oxidoreductase [Dactylosporangium fulvum]